MKIIFSFALFLATVLSVSGLRNFEMNGFATTPENSKEMRVAMQHYLQDSISQLFKSYSYLDQSQERPGIAKLLKEHSDKRWSQGVELLQKYVKRGGLVLVNESHWNVDATKSHCHGVKSYTADIESLVKSSEAMGDKLRTVYHHATRTAHLDPDMMHFMEERMEDEVKTHYELSSLKTILTQMEAEALAKHFFDEHLL